MQGVIILALKKSSYFTSAFNLALSIKYHNPKIHITLVSDGKHADHYLPEHYAVFDWIKYIKEEHYMGADNKFQPALAKININKYTMYDQTLYIDADSLCLQDIQPLFDKLKHYPFKANNIPGYTQWTDEETFTSFFKVPLGLTINSSWIYFENSDVFNKAQEFYKKGFPADKVVPVWGGSYPDELFFNAAITATDTDPISSTEVMFFGNNIDKRTLSELERDFYFFTLYGNKTTVRKIYIDFYDKLLFKMCEKNGLEHRYKAHAILVGKHVNR